jgi:phosphatidylserine decarboxylase
MTANDEAVEEFVGGTVHQAFLSATNYHRWHIPVAGTIVRPFLVEHTYYSGADSLGSDPAEPTHSQAYVAHVATRVAFLIRADNPAIGLVGLEVSSCLIHLSLETGHHVVKGEESGHFQFGGSTHRLVFGPGVMGDFVTTASPTPRP